MVELRRYSRSRIDQEVVYTTKGGTRETGMGRDISLGGMFIETEKPSPFGAEVTVSFTPAGSDVAMSLPGVVRWTSPEGMGLQFGLIGARETHALVQLQRELEAKK